MFVRKHGLTHSFEFNVWTAMRKRCNYSKHPKYHLYGGRGIKVCERWQLFINFYADMGVCPFPKGSIERINADGMYEPNNCIWLPKAEQSKTRRNVQKIEGLTIPELSVKYGIKESTIRLRLKANWPQSKLFVAPTVLGTRRV